MKTKLLSLSALSLAILVWGIDAIAIELAIKGGINEIFLAFARITIAFLLFAVLHLILKRGERIKIRHWKYVILSGVSGMALYWVLENKGIGYTSGALASVLLAAVPVLGLIGDRIFFKSKFTAKKVTAIIGCVIGMYVVVTGGAGDTALSGTIKGFLFMIAAAICWTLFIIFSKPLLENYSIVTVLMYQSFIGTLFLTPLSIGKWPDTGAITWQNIALIVFMALICTCLADFVFQIGVKGLNVTIVAAFESLIPVLSVITGYIVFKETLTLQQFLGGAIIIGAVLIISFTADDVKKSDKNAVKTVPVNQKIM